MKSHGGRGWFDNSGQVLRHGTPVMHYSLLAHAFRLLNSDKKEKEKDKKKKEKEERKSKRQETLTDAMFSQDSSAVSLMEQAIIFLRLGTFCSCSDTQKVYNTQ